MDVQLVTQPFKDSGTLAEFLDHAASLQDMSEAKFVVAWAKRSGLKVIRPALDAFRSRGIRTSLVVGIDQGGATRQGLQLAIASFDAVHVFHDPHGGTFHPKLYWIGGGVTAHLFVGSNNLTEGGARANYEVALACILDLSNTADARLQQAVLQYIDRLLADVSVCRPLTATLLDDLIADPRYGIGDEDAARTRTTATAAHGDQAVLEPFFGRSAEPKKGRPPATPAEEPDESGTELPEDYTLEAPTEVAPPPLVVVATTPQPPLAGPAPIAAVVARWYKQLPSSDAQHPEKPASSPTGNLRLNRAGSGVDWRRYFRDDLFGSAVWVPHTLPVGVLEATSIPFHVTIAGNYIGPTPLTVDYGAYREAGQGNVTTVLHWGLLLPALRATNYFGYSL